MAEGSQGGFRKFMSSVSSGIQSGISSIQKQGSGSSTFYPTTLGQQKSSKSGWLKKQGGVVKSWHRRWFTLKGDSLYYYSTEDESKTPLGSIFLPGNKVVEHPLNPQEPDKFLFEVQPGGDKSQMSLTHDTYPMCAVSDDERKGWVKAIRKVMYADKGGGIFGQSLEDTMRYEQAQSSSRKVPRIVELCVDFLRNNGLQVEGLFRLPGRSTLVRDLREAFDCGEQPNFDMCEMDIHSIASLLKSYLRELPEPIIPVQFYDSVRKVVMRDLHQNPDTAYERMYNLLTNIPQQNYNLLQFLCRFLQEVASNSDVNKMTSMNLATVFAQSVVRPEDEDPAILMGTAQARTQIVFVLISQCDHVFRLEYTPQGGSVRVDNLVSFDAADEGTDSVNVDPSQTAVPHSASFQNDLMGLDLTMPCEPQNATSGYEDTSAPVTQSGVRTSQPPDLLMDTAATTAVQDTEEEEIDPYYSYAPPDNGLNNQVPQEQAPEDHSDPLYDNAKNVEANVIQDGVYDNEESNDSSPGEDQPGYARVNLENKVQQRSVKNRSARVYSEAGVISFTREQTKPRQPPPPPPRPSQRFMEDSISSTDSLDVQQEPSEEDQAFEALLNMDLTSFGVEDLRTHIQTLCIELRTQRSKVTELTNQQQDLKKRHTEKVHKLAQKLDQEKTATLDAVDRIMKLQNQLQQYQMKYGPLE